jgi:hypothetical protein
VSAVSIKVELRLDPQLTEPASEGGVLFSDSGFDLVSDGAL